MIRALALALTMTISTAMPSTVLAAVSDADLQQLRQQLAAVTARLDALEQENAALKQAQAATTTAVAAVGNPTATADIAASHQSADSWSDRISLDGDFRFRYETIDVGDAENRTRSRIRARTKLKAEVADNLDVVVGLATGGDDPVSTNQTIGGGGSSKNIALNLAYVDWEATEGLHLFAGKFRNPYFSVGDQPLLWDGDWNPEGVALSFERDWFFVNAVGTWLESDSRSNNDSFSYGGQFGARTDLGGATLTAGLAWYLFNTAGLPTAYGDPTDPGDYFGNTAVDGNGLPCGTVSGSACRYLYDYKLTEVFAEAAFDLGDWPVVVFADYVHNSDPADNNSAWSAGASIGETKNSGDLAFSYYYADKEADALLGLVTDSDFAGGGTDNRGHFLQVSYGVSKSWVIAAQYFINDTNYSSGNPGDYDRLMLDTQWKWK